MIIATSNDIFNTAPTLSTGSTTDSMASVATSNFSENITITPSGSDLTITMGAVTCSYVALHGVSFSNAPRGSSITVSVRDGATLLSSFVINSGFSDCMMVFTERACSNLLITMAGVSGDVTMSYLAAGLSTEVPFGGAKPGQVLPYLQYNYKTKANENSIGLPTNQRLRRVSTQVNINLNNMPIEWVRDDLKQVFDLYKETQVVSMRDFESEAYPTESWAGFQLSQTKASTYNGTRKLVSVPLTFKASCDYVGYYD